MNYTKITDINQLKQENMQDCFIHLGIARSSKEIYYCSKTNTFEVWHSIDDTYIEMTSDEIMADNIGKAIINGNFYRIDE